MAAPYPVLWPRSTLGLTSDTMPALDTLPLWVVAALLGGLVLLGLWLGNRFAAWRIRRRIARHRSLGRRGEQRAVSLLEAAGYRIEDAQTSSHLEVEVDGELQRFLVR